ncbi:hypothetical protein MHB77_23845 [Paenibacillus sp. FSL K6-3166]|uniref:hypothetical protein n=1 Tax=unclassified Paenibacillus TaxID=185978 RepID=UPI000B9FE8BF|nr:hypothetical protein [Paenibacillus sp. VTT E-133291]OZQ91434.1 hypothetical protein CA598_11855 [Paenibacillus sp. VTT E-133291]
MDLSWWGSFDGEYWNDLILDIERENQLEKDEETLDKLFCDRVNIPINVIGIMNVRNRDRIDELIKTANKMCKLENALLVFKTYSTGKKQIDEVHAYLINKDKIVESKKAFVSSFTFNWENGLQ